MTKYRRAFVPGGTYFFTVVLANRSSTLLVDNIELLRNSFRQEQKVRPFELVAAVVLPEHLHCIWTLPEGDCDYPLRWNRIKVGFSRRLPAAERVSASRSSKRERGLWQRRYWEHCIRDRDDLQRHLDYIHYNPVKHGLVSSPKEWPYSSFRRFVARGYYPLDWGDEPEPMPTGE